MTPRRLALPAALTAAVAGLLALLLTGAVFSQNPAVAATATLNTAKVPPAYVDLIQAAARTCPQITAPLLAAQEQAESGFHPGAVSPAGAQGIAQIIPSTWAQYGRDENGDGRADPLDPQDAIAAQARIMCDLVDQVQAAGIPGDVIDLALAAYNAGIGAVLRYRGIPPYAETTTYVTRVRRLQVDFTSLPGGTGPAPDGSWPSETCSIVPDPTTGHGCLTPRTATLVAQLRAAGYRRIACWDAHEWNPNSDHPRGKACDVTFGPGGVLPSPAQKAAGDQLAAQLQAAARTLGVNYLIWSGRIWSAAHSKDGWQPYNGGGVYDPKDITGGHFDHVHISMH